MKLMDAWETVDRLRQRFAGSHVEVHLTADWEPEGYGAVLTNRDVQARIVRPSEERNALAAMEEIDDE